MEVNYLAEVMLGDEVLIRNQRAAKADNLILAAISAKSDGKDAARARFELG
jgi:hypothetical protein